MKKKTSKNIKRAVGSATVVTLMTVGQLVNAESVDETQVQPSTQPETTEVALTQDQQIAKAEQKVEQANEEVSTANEFATQTAEAVTNATEYVAQAQEEVEEANQVVVQEQENVAVAEENHQQSQQAVETAKDNNNQAKAEADEANQNLTAVQAETADKAIQLKNEVDNASDVTTTTTTQTVKETGATADTTKYKANNPTTPQETVAYSGTAVEDIQLTAEQSEELAKTGVFTYTPDIQAINQHFINYVAQLRALNGIEIPSTAHSAQAQAYADARIQEILNGSKKDFLGLPTLNHQTNLGEERTFENLSAFTWSFVNDGTDTNTTRVMSDKELAYRIALGWFADYGNISSGGYGHRDALLFGASDSQAVSIGSINYAPFAGVNRTRYYIASVGVDEEGKETYEQYAQIASNMRLYNVSVDPTTHSYTLNGKQVVFLPMTTFNYIATITNTIPTSEKAEAQAKYVAYLAQAQQLVAQAQSKADEANQNVLSTNALLEQAEAQAVITAQKVEEARQALANAVAVAGDKTQAYNDAKAVLSEAEAKHAEAVQNLAQAKDKQAKAVEALEALTGQKVDVPVLPEVPNPAEPSNGGNTDTPSDNGGNTNTPSDNGGGAVDTPVDNGGSTDKPTPIDDEPTIDNPFNPARPIEEPTIDKPFIPADGGTILKPTDPIVTISTDPISGRPIVAIDEPVKTDKPSDNKVQVTFGGLTIDVDGVASNVKDNVSNVAKRAREEIQDGVDAFVGGIGGAVVKADETKTTNKKEDTAKTDSSSSSSSSSSSEKEDTSSSSSSKSTANTTAKKSNKSDNSVVALVSCLVVAGLAGVGIYKAVKKPKAPQGSDNNENIG